MGTVRVQISVSVFAEASRIRSRRFSGICFGILVQNNKIDKKYQVLQKSRILNIRYKNIKSVFKMERAAVFQMKRKECANVHSFNNMCRYQIRCGDRYLEKEGK